MNEIPYRRPDGDPRAEEVAGLVREIAANRRALLPYRAAFPDLTRIVKDPWRTETPAVDLAAVIAQLPDEQTVSVRLHDQLELDVRETPLGRPVREAPGRIAFKRGWAETGSVDGPVPVLDMLQAILPKRVDDVAAALLPVDPDALDAAIERDRRTVERLIAEGRELVERVERLVCALYEVPLDLADEVVVHAVKRAARRSAHGDPDPDT